MQSAKASGTTTNKAVSPSAHPAWLAPLVVVVVVAALFAGSRKREEVVENPVVELLLITVGVFAMAAALGVAFTKLGSPGAAAFFGRNYQASTTGEVQ